MSDLSYFIEPVDLAAIAGTNVADQGTTHGAFVVGSYSIGNTVTYMHGVYESRVNTNAATPSGDGTTTTEWLYLGPLNSKAPFDNSYETQATRTDSLYYTAQMTNPTGACAILNVTGLNVTVVGTDGFGGPEVYNRVVDLLVPVSDPFEWCFFPIERKTDVILSDLPMYANLYLTITVNNPGGVAGLGVLHIGRARTIGTAEYNTGVELRDYSRIEEDENFGGVRVVTKLGYSNKLSSPIFLRPDEVANVRRRLNARRAIPTVYVASDIYEPTIIYGIFKNLRFIFEDYETSRFNLEVWGMK